MSSTAAQYIWQSIKETKYPYKYISASNIIIILNALKTIKWASSESESRECVHTKQREYINRQW